MNCIIFAGVAQPLRWIRWQMAVLMGTMKTIRYTVMVVLVVELMGFLGQALEAGETAAAMEVMEAMEVEAIDLEWDKVPPLESLERRTANFTPVVEAVLDGQEVGLAENQEVDEALIALLVERMLLTTGVEAAAGPMTIGLAKAIKALPLFETQRRRQYELCAY